MSANDNSARPARGQSGRHAHGTKIDTTALTIAAVWIQHAPALAAWVKKLLVNRQDAFGHYRPLAARSEEDTAYADKSPLTLAVLKRHFLAGDLGDLIGLYSTFRDEAGACWCRWIAIDIDRHHDQTDPEANWKAALALYARCIALGFTPLLLDSNGWGGFHLIVIFDNPIPAQDAYHFGKWLRRDWQALGLEEDPEVFPKQPAITESGYGNWLRLFGRHHTIDHHTRIWDGSQWLEGLAAIKAILKLQGDSPSLIPAEAKVPPPPPRPKARSRPADYEKDAKLAAEALDYLEPSIGYKSWLDIGMALTKLGREGLELWDRWSSVSEKYREGICDRKWRSFRRTEGEIITLGTLFHMAKPKGFEFPNKRGSHGKAAGDTHQANGQPPPTNGRFHPPEPDEPPPLPEIEINTEWYRAIAAGIEALRADPDLYVHAGSLVNVIHEVEDEIRISTRLAIKGVAGSPRIASISGANIGSRLTQYAWLFAWSPDKDGELTSHRVRPPDWLIKAIATHNEWPGIRKLKAVVESPFPRPDGSIVEAPGYDRATATLYLPSIEFPPIPEHPTRDDARAAWERIKPYIREFPFPTEDDRIIYLAGLLTVIARQAIIGPVPGIAVIGNKAGTGKGLFIDAMTIPGTGRSCPTSTYPVSTEEATKVKVSIAKAGKVAVHFDNLDEGSLYGNGPLDSALTSTHTDERQLGGNESPPLPLRPAWFLSGNNVSPGKDAHRRWLVCHIRTELEHPEERNDFEQADLRAVILEHRGEIVRDALTILRAHTLAGRPHQRGWPGFGSFDDWDYVVRGAVWFATDRDCLTTQRQMANDSPERLAKIALLEGWSELPEGKAGEEGVTVSRAIELVNAAGENTYQTLRSALMARGKGGKMITPTALGYVLRGLKDMPIDGFRFRENGLSHRTILWVVEGKPSTVFDKTLNSENSGGDRGGDGGDGGDDPGTPHGTSGFSPHMKMSGENPEKASDGPGVSPPSPPSPPDPDRAEVHRIRQEVRNWPKARHQAWVTLVDQLQDQGDTWAQAEIEAYHRLRNRPQ